MPIKAVTAETAPQLETTTATAPLSEAAATATTTEDYVYKYVFNATIQFIASGQTFQPGAFAQYCDCPCKTTTSSAIAEGAKPN